MSSTVKIEAAANNRIVVTSPYHPKLPKLARELGGKWDGAHWTFDARDESRVRELLIGIYGTDGSQAAGEQAMLTLLVDCDRLTWNSPSFWLAGREVVSRLSRDASVRLGEGVSIVSGGFLGSGGSMKYPQLGTPRDGTVLRIRDIPERAAVAALSNAVRIEQAPDTVEAERARLTARRAELLAELQTVETQLAALTSTESES